MRRCLLVSLLAFAVGFVAGIAAWMQFDYFRAVVWYFLNRWGA